MVEAQPQYFKTGDIPQIKNVGNVIKENTLSKPALVTDEDCRVFMTERGKGWVCELDNHLESFFIVDVKENNIWALFVHPYLDRLGNDRQLHNNLLYSYFKITQEKLWLGTAPGTRAETFYRKAGWTETGMHGKGEIKFEMTYNEWVTKNKRI